MTVSVDVSLCRQVHVSPVWILDLRRAADASQELLVHVSPVWILDLRIV
jgi:hypothetical protein